MRCRTVFFPGRATLQRFFLMPTNNMLSWLPQDWLHPEVAEMGYTHVATRTSRVGVGYTRIDVRAGWGKDFVVLCSATIADYMFFGSSFEMVKPLMVVRRRMLCDLGREVMERANSAPNPWPTAYFAS